MIESLIILCSVVLLASLYYNRRNLHKKWLPGPISIPFFGCALQIAWSSLKYKNFEIFDEYCKKYGSVVGLQAGLQYIVVIEDFETAKSVLFSEDWSGRMPDHPMYQELTFDKNIGIMFGFGNGWKENRRFVLKNLREYGFGMKSTMEYHLNDEVQHFLTAFEETRKLKNSVVSMHQCFKLSSLNVLWRTLCGTRLDENDETIKYFISRIEDTVVNTKIGSQPKYAFPFLRYIPYLTDAQYQVEGMKMAHEYFQKILEERRKEGKFRIRQNDFIDMYLLQIEETKKIPKTTFTDEQLIQSCTDMFLAGADTTGSSLEFAMLYMLMFPEIQKKVQDEIDRIIPKDQIPNLGSRQNMPYTEAVLLETLRYATTVPIIPRSCCSTETNLNGYYVPKNTLAVINAYKINHNEKIWKNPEEFNPERFLDGNGCILKDAANMMLSFGAGKRLCVGITSAKASLFTFFTSFLQKYTIEPSLNHPDISLKSVVSGVNNQPKPYTCIVKLRI